MSIEKIKQIAEQMPDSPERQTALQAYHNLKLFEVIAEPFENLVEKAARRLALTGDHRNLKKIRRKEGEKCII